MRELTPTHARRRRPRKLRKEPVDSQTGGPQSAQPTELEVPPAIGLPKAEENDALPEAVEASITIPKETENASSVSPTRKRRRPRKIAIRSKKVEAASTIDGSERNDSPVEEPKSPGARPIEDRVTVLEHRIDGIDGKVEAAVVGVEQLKLKGKGRRRSKARTDKAPEEHASEQLTILEVESDIEEIPRTSSPSLDRPSKEQPSSTHTAAKPQQNPLILHGNYSVPLPKGVTPKDVQAVRTGARAAGSIAREINAAFTTRVRTSQDFSLNRTSVGGLLSQATRMMTEAINSVDFDAAIRDSEPRPDGRTQTGPRPGARKFGVRSRPSTKISRSVSASVPLSNEQEHRRMKQRGLDYSQI